MSESNSIIQKVKELRVDALYGKKKHFNAAELKEKKHIYLGLPVVIINIIVGSLLFAILADAVPNWSKWVGAFLALIAALCSGIQTFFNFPKFIEGHHNVGARYLSVAKECSRIIAYLKDGQISPSDLREQLERLAHTCDQINIDAQAFSTSKEDYEKTRSDFKEEETYLDVELNYTGE